jgi:3-hydroxyacyl-CoA dehydrogenase
MKTLADIKKIAVLGAGTMGPGIAQTYAMGGYQVAMWTRSESTREKAKAALKTQLETFAEEGEIKAEDIPAILGRVSFALTVEEAVAGADFIQETIVENRDAKIALYEQLAACVGPDVIVASNTSALNIFEIVPEQLLPQQIICHWYAPPQLIPLVEVVKSEQAPQELADVAVELLQKCGKTAVLMKKFIRGYIVNRLQQCLNQEVFYLLEHGYCDAEAIDLACKASFIPRACVLGLCKRMDFGGVDMTANNFRNHSYEMPHPPEDEVVPKVLNEMVAENHLGIKTGQGFYDYSDVDLEKLKAKRDKQLFEVFRLQKKFLADPV